MYILTFLTVTTDALFRHYIILADWIDLNNLFSFRLRGSMTFEGELWLR